MAASFALVAAGAGWSFFKPASAFLTTPLGSPSLAGRSNNTTGTSALAQWVAICAPITPAPSTATLRTVILLTLVSSVCRRRNVSVPPAGAVSLWLPKRWKARNAHSF